MYIVYKCTVACVCSVNTFSPKAFKLNKMCGVREESYLSIIWRVTYSASYWGRQFVKSYHITAIFMKAVT